MFIIFCAEGWAYVCNIDEVLKLFYMELFKPGRVWEGTLPPPLLKKFHEGGGTVYPKYFKF